MTYYTTNEDMIWKALGDAKRRRVLEELLSGPKLTGDLVDLFPDIGRTGVLRHMNLLAECMMILVRAEGRKLWNHLNVEPIRTVCNSWVAQHIDGITESANRLKEIAEQNNKGKLA